MLQDEWSAFCTLSGTQPVGSLIRLCHASISANRSSYVSATAALSSTGLQILKINSISGTKHVQVEIGSLRTFPFFDTDGLRRSLNEEIPPLLAIATDLNSVPVRFNYGLASTMRAPARQPARLSDPQSPSRTNSLRLSPPEKGKRLGTF